MTEIEQVVERLERVAQKLQRATADKYVDEWLTPEEFERVTGLTKRWLYDHAHELDFVRKVDGSRLYRISRKGLYRWMATRPTVGDHRISA